jgi:hypothetical protein
MNTLYSYFKCATFCLGIGYFSSVVYLLIQWEVLDQCWPMAYSLSHFEQRGFQYNDNKWSEEDGSKAMLETPFIHNVTKATYRIQRNNEVNERSYETFRWRFRCWNHLTIARQKKEPLTWTILQRIMLRNVIKIILITFFLLWDGLAENGFCSVIWKILPDTFASSIMRVFYSVPLIFETIFFTINTIM